MLTKLAQWTAEEPVRAYLGTLVGAIIALLVGYGILTGEQAGLWLGLATAGLGFPAVRKARSRVRPVWRSRPVEPPRADVDPRH